MNMVKMFASSGLSIYRFMSRNRSIPGGAKALRDDALQ
jgi:hypothetical protein